MAGSNQLFKITLKGDTLYEVSNYKKYKSIAKEAYPKYYKNK